MVDKLEKNGELQPIIDQALQESEGVGQDFGRGGGKGLAAFLDVTTRMDSNKSFRENINARLRASDVLATAVEEELVRRVPTYFAWNRKEGQGPSIKVAANRLAFATGEILRRFEEERK